MAIEVVDLNFESDKHCQALLKILGTYAAEDGGGQQGIAANVQSELPALLNEVPGRQVFLALVDSEPAGVAVCFTGFSTFKAKPVLNIHDLAALPGFRGKGIGTALLAAVDQRASALGCCKITLEVIGTNEGARRLYERSGFRDPTKKAPTFFLEKKM